MSWATVPNSPASRPAWGKGPAQAKWAMPNTYLHDIDPIALGLPFWPHGIHWYGLMYLLGFGVAWWLGRSRVARRPPARRERRTRLRRPVVLRHARRRPRWPRRLRAVLRVRQRSSPNPLMPVADLRRRHEFPRRPAGRDDRGRCGGRANRNCISSTPWISSRRWCRRAWASAASAISSVASCGASYTDGELGRDFPARDLRSYTGWTIGSSCRRCMRRGALDAYRAPSLAALPGVPGRPGDVRASCGGSRASRGRAMRCRACSRCCTACSVSWSNSCACPMSGIGYLAFGWLTMGQVLSLPLIALGLFLLWLSRRSPTLQPVVLRRTPHEAIPRPAAPCAGTRHARNRIAPAPARVRCSAGRCALI